MISSSLLSGKPNSTVGSTKGWGKRAPCGRRPWEHPYCVQSAGRRNETAPSTQHKMMAQMPGKCLVPANHLKAHLRWKKSWEICRNSFLESLKEQRGSIWIINTNWIMHPHNPMIVTQFMSTCLKLNPFLFSILHSSKYHFSGKLFSLSFWKDKKVLQLVPETYHTSLYKKNTHTHTYTHMYVCIHTFGYRYFKIINTDESKKL